MFIRLGRGSSVATCVGIAILTIQSVNGQTFTAFNVPGPASWANDANWSGGLPPEALYNESGDIISGNSAYVDSEVLRPGGIRVQNGVLDVRSGGTLIAEPGPGSLATGQLWAGFGSAPGPADIIVQRGGTLDVRRVVTGGNSQASITVGAVGGSGLAKFYFTDGEFNRNLRIVGPNADVKASGNVTFSGAQTFAPVITGATHSSIQVTGEAKLGGTLRPEFSGYMPTLGSSWNLLTAQNVSGKFAVDDSLTPSRPRGAAYFVSTSPTAVTLNYSNKLILAVDRGTGAMKIENAIGNSLAIDGYTIVSAAGLLNGNWNSLKDQAVAGWDEADTSNATRITEFKTNGTTSIAVGASRSLGTPLLPSAFGQNATVSFQYTLPGSTMVEGIVEYTGRENNLVLTIDPTTGEAAIQNESSYFDVAIDGYTLKSASGKFLTGAAWSSLEDQGLPGWDQADSSDANRLVEFRTSGGTPLIGGQTVLDLGAPVSLAAGALNLNDFQFQFTLSTGQIMDGIVKFGAVPTAGSSPGDFNRDGRVDGSDFLLWQRGYNTSVANGTGADGNGNGLIDGPDLAIWKLNFGNSVAAVAPANSAVPEPATLGMVLVAMGSLFVKRSRS